MKGKLARRSLFNGKLNISRVKIPVTPNYKQNLDWDCSLWFSSWFGDDFLITLFDRSLRVSQNILNTK